MTTSRSEPWTDRNDDELRRRLDSGEFAVAIVRALERSALAIRSRLTRGQPTKPGPVELINADRALLRAAEFDGLAWALPRISDAVAMRLERAHLIGHHHGQWYLRLRGFKARVESGGIVA